MSESEELLRDSDEELSKKDKKTKGGSSDDSEIVIDDSESDIEEVCEVPSPKLVQTQARSNALKNSKPGSETPTNSIKAGSLDENKIKSILNNAAASKNNSPAVKLKISVTGTKQTEPKSEPATPKIVLQKVGSKWQNSSLTPLSSKVKHNQGPKKTTVDSSESDNGNNSDEDFVPGSKGSIKVTTRKSRKSDDSDSWDSDETIPLHNRSTRSTRSSMNTSKSDISQDVSIDASEDFDGEIQEELAKLEALQNILAQTNPAKSNTIKNQQKPKKLKTSTKSLKLDKASKLSVADSSRLTPKPKPVAVPKVIERGPIDCFDDLIVETSVGFPCNFCDSKEMFNKRREMIHHMQTQHDEELNDEQRNRDLSGLFSCEICNTIFHSKFILRTHKKAHVKSAVAGCDKYYQYYLKFGNV